MEQEELREPITIKRIKYEKIHEKQRRSINWKGINGTQFIFEAGYLVLDRNVENPAGDKMRLLDLQLHTSYKFPFSTIYPFIWRRRFDEEPKRLVMRLNSSMEHNS